MCVIKFLSWVMYLFFVCNVCIVRCFCIVTCFSCLRFLSLYVDFGFALSVSLYTNVGALCFEMSTSGISAEMWHSSRSSWSLKRE
jgi:hypothetical protein